VKGSDFSATLKPGRMVTRSNIASNDAFSGEKAVIGTDVMNSSATQRHGRKLTRSTSLDKRLNGSPDDTTVKLSENANSTGTQKPARISSRSSSVDRRRNSRSIASDIIGNSSRPGTPHSIVVSKGEIEGKDFLPNLMDQARERAASNDIRERTNSKDSPSGKGHVRTGSWGSRSITICSSTAGLSVDDSERIYSTLSNEFQLGVNSTR